MRKMRQAVLLTLGVAFLVGLSSSPLWGRSPSSRKMVRQIGVMESIIDKVLIDSPYFLVSGGDNARGLYLDGFGAIFTFDASLVGKKWMFFSDKMYSLGENFKIETNEDGDRVIIIKGKKSREKDEQELADEDDEWDPEKVYENGKKELVQALADYGETLSALKNEEHVVIAAFLKGSDYFKERQISRLILKVKIKDLRDFSADRISESTLKSRIQIEEY